MRPSDCLICKENFLSRPILMAEISHFAATMGEGIARSELDERLEWQHTEERHEPTDR